MNQRTTKKCPRCGTISGAGGDDRFCRACGTLLEPDDDDDPSKHHGEEEPFSPKRPRRPEEPDWPAASDGYCPWEDQENLGFLGGLTQTLFQSVTSPSEFFANLPTSAGFALPLLYALIVETVGWLLNYVWAVTFKHPLLAALDLSGINAVLAGITVLVMVLLGIFFWAFLLHFSISAVGRVRGPFETTFRIVCYASGPALCRVMPLFGSLIGLAVSLSLTVIAIREIYGTTTQRAALAVLIPLVFWFGVFLTLAAVIGFPGLTPR